MTSTSFEDFVYDIRHQPVKDSCPSTLSQRNTGAPCVVKVREPEKPVADPGFPRRGRQPLSLGQNPII